MLISLLVLSASFSNRKTRNLFTPWKLGSTKWFKFGFCSNNSGFDRYLFQLTVLLKRDFNWGNTFALSWVYKVTTGTFVSVISEVGLWFAALV